MTPYEITVVAAIIKKNNQYLIARRKKELNGGGFWEFPGGKLEPGETHREALKREIKEELELECEIGEFFGENIVQFGVKKYHLYAFFIQKFSGQIKLNEHDDVKWVTPDQFQHYEFIEGDKLFIKMLSAQ